MNERPVRRRLEQPMRKNPDAALRTRIRMVLLYRKGGAQTNSPSSGMLTRHRRASRPPF